MSDDTSPTPKTASQPPRRRPHRKAKTGCADCRRRRVKCDEAKPVCSACARRKHNCEYPPVDLDKSRHLNDLRPRTSSPTHLTPETHKSLLENTPSISSSPTLSAGLGRLASDGGVTYDLQDLFLLHHWSFTVSSTICLARDEVDLWSRGFPEIGFQHPFVNRALLSVAALHLAQDSSDQKRQRQHMTCAVGHHNASLAGFRSAVAGITRENSEALFVWSLLNLIYVFGMFVLSPSPGKDVVLGAEWIPMMHGIGAILTPVRENLSGGRMSTFFNLGNFFELDLDAITGNDIDTQLCRLSEIWDSGGDAATYEETLRLVRRCHRFVAQFESMREEDIAQWGYNRAWSGPMIFIQLAPEAYFELLHQRQPPALVLFAFFGALLHQIREYWFIRDLGNNIIQVVEDLLGPYWQPWIAWPLDCARG